MKGWDKGHQWMRDCMDAWMHGWEKIPDGPSTALVTCVCVCVCCVHTYVRMYVVRYAYIH